MRLLRFLAAAPGARIYLVEGFATESEVAGILAAAEQSALEPDIAAVAKHDRTGFSFEMPVDGQPLLRAIAARTGAALGFANQQPASMRFRRYKPGEAHRAHSDVYQIEEAYLVATAMLWLEQPEAGGETLFPNAGPDGVRLTPRRGCLALWLNYAEDGSADPRTVNEALPVLRGTKTTITSFIDAHLDAAPAFARTARALPMPAGPAPPA